MKVRSFSLRFIRDLKFTTLSTMLLAGVNFLTQIVVIRVVDKEAFGYYSFAFSFFNIAELMLLSINGEYGFHQISKAIIAENQHRIQATFAYLFKADLILLGSGTLIFLIAGALPWPDSTLRFDFMCILGLSLICQTGYGLVKSTLISLQLIELQSKYEMACSIIMLAVTVTFTYLSGITGLLWSYPAYALLKNVLGFIVLYRYTPFRLLLRSSDADSNGPLPDRNAWQIVLTLSRNALLQLSNQMDLLLVGMFISPVALASYKVAKSLASVFTRFSYPFWAALRGRISEAWHKNKRDRLVEVILKPTRYSVMAFLLLLPVIILGGKQFITLLYGPLYEDAYVPFLFILTGSTVFASTNNWFSFWIILAARQLTGIYLLGAQLICMILLGAFLGNRSTDWMAAVTGVVMVVTAGLQVLVFIRELNQLKTEE